MLSVSIRSMRLGTDPEIFAMSNGTVFPAYKWLPSKSASAGLFWDGVQAEFTVNPDICIAWIVDRIHNKLRDAKAILDRLPHNARLSTASVVDYPEEERRDALNEFVQLGCKPSMNVYGMGGELVTNGRDLPVRFAGGHVHVELPRGTLLEPCVKMLDAILGVWSVGAAASFDNPIRRRYYGLPGEYRPTKYGLEYRSLSNFWLMHPALTHLMFEIARATISLVLGNQHNNWLAAEDEVIGAIVTSDARTARAILHRNKDVFTALLNLTVREKGALEALRAGMYGLESVIVEPTEIERNWRLNDVWLSHSEGANCSWKSLATA